ncbi:hypothetical protein LHJ74_28780 [Streptomyces sp. N2-109]|uniref:Lipoprotein n=1 Tax=Streptomyces gossypii TaxID=2883101 RepID=A0ABT2K115_9ACTN|nr:hypothetical protein [Streptomyces gossypii]MCT2593855.1 hypothetical protein [Streptomyces gossypii]
MALCLGAGLLGGWGINDDGPGHHLTYDDSVSAAATSKYWPSRGGRQDDEELLRAAARAFAFYRERTGQFDARARANELSAGEPTVLFAGSLGAKKVPTVLLGSRQVLFRYEEREGEKADSPLTTPSPYAVESLPRTVQYGSSPLVLNPSRNGSAPRKDLRLLVPEGMTKLRVAGFEGKSYDWRPVTVKNGVTGPLRTYDPSFTSVSREDQRHSIGGCRDHGLLLRATIEPSTGESHEMFYVVRGKDFHAVSARLGGHRHVRRPACPHPGPVAHVRERARRVGRAHHRGVLGAGMDR